MGRECLVSHETHIFYNLFCVSRAWLEILSRASLVMGSSEDLSQVKQAKDLLLLLLLAYEQYIGVSQSSVHNHIFTSSIEFLFLSYSKKKRKKFLPSTFTLDFSLLLLCCVVCGEMLQFVDNFCY
jgi:hypothetical protein